MSHDFYAYYSTLSNVELLQIQEKKEQYQPEAIAAAIAVLQNRAITEEDHQALAALRQDDEAREQQKKDKKEALLSLGQQMAETFTPGKKTIEQQLILFCAGLLILFLFRAFKEIYSVYLYTNNGQFFRLYNLLRLADLIYTPTMILLLFKRLKVGWLIAAVIYTAAFTTAIGDIFFYWGSAHDTFGLRPSMGSQLFALVLNGGILYYLNTAAFIRLFAVSTKWQFTAIILSAVGCVLLLLSRRW